MKSTQCIVSTLLFVFNEQDQYCCNAVAVRSTRANGAPREESVTSAKESLPISVPLARPRGTLHPRAPGTIPPHWHGDGTITG